MKLKKTDLVYGLPFFTGLILEIFAVDLFRLTFISTKITVGLYLASGILGLLILGKRIQAPFKYKALNLIISLTYCVISIGGTLTFALLALNYYLAAPAGTNQTFAIQKTGTLGMARSGTAPLPFVEIEKDGLTKEIIFNQKFPKDVAAYKNLDLTISKGGIGYDIIRNKALVE